MFMARGEYLPMREPTESEVKAAVDTLTRQGFVPAYVGSKEYSLTRFLKTYLRTTVRWLAFEVIRVLRRFPLDYRYLSTRWAACGYRVRLQDWRVMRYLDRDWARTLQATPPDCRLFVALSVNPEAAIEYWVKSPDLIDYRRVLDRLVRIFKEAGWHLFVKDHPSQFAFREVEFFGDLARHENVTLVPYEVPAQVLIDQCAGTFTWTGTVGFQAALAGQCAAIESGAYYLLEDYFVVIRSRSDLDELPRRIHEFSRPHDLTNTRRVLVRHLLRSSAPGDYSSWQRFSERDPNCLARVESLVHSMNQYLVKVSTVKSQGATSRDVLGNDNREEANPRPSKGNQERK
jgi:hypothetical protein